MNDESARNASRLRMNACVCSHALHGQFAHTWLPTEKKVRYFVNRTRTILHIPEVLITSIAIDRSIAKELWVDHRTAFKKIKFKRIF